MSVTCCKDSRENSVADEYLYCNSCTKEMYRAEIERETVAAIVAWLRTTERDFVDPHIVDAIERGAYKGRCPNGYTIDATGYCCGTAHATAEAPQEPNIATAATALVDYLQDEATYPLAYEGGFRELVIALALAGMRAR